VPPRFPAGIFRVGMAGFFYVPMKNIFNWVFMSRFPVTTLEGVVETILPEFTPDSDVLNGASGLLFYGL